MTKFEANLGKINFLAAKRPGRRIALDKRATWKTEAAFTGFSKLLSLPFSRCLVLWLSNCHL